MTDDIEQQRKTQPYYSAVHKRPQPAIPPQNFDMTELEDTLCDDTMLKHSKQTTEDIDVQTEHNSSYKHAPNELNIYAEPLHAGP